LARRRRHGRSVDGIFLLNKPTGLSSNQALQRVRRLFDANKAGHTGALDPLATGVLPLCLGEATKFSQFLLDAEKIYRSTYILGVTTTTGDSEGEVVKQTDASDITRRQVEAGLAEFTGEIEQVPSMYSALKHRGQPLYKLARKGVEVERQSRTISVYRYQLLDFKPGPKPEVEVEVHCSKGAYIRTLAQDLGEALGCGAHVSALHRVKSGPFEESQTLTLEALEELAADQEPTQLDHLLLPVDTAVADRMAVELDEVVASYFQLGQPVMSNKAFRQGQEGDIVRVFRHGGTFLGIGKVTEEGKVAPKRLIVEAV